MKLIYRALRITWANVDEIVNIMQEVGGGHLTPYVGPGRSMDLGPGVWFPGQRGDRGAPGDWVVLWGSGNVSVHRDKRRLPDALSLRLLGY